MDRLISQGMHSFSQGDHARMHALWSGTTVFSHLDNEAIASLLASIQATAESGQGSEWSWLMLCLVYLDSSDQFTEDRSAALRQVGEWAQRALAMSPGNAYGHRYLGSAHYWLDEPEPALAAYRKSHALQPQADLQARIFEMEHAVPWRSIFSYPELADSPAAPDYYTAGVTVGKWKRPDTDAAALQEIERLQTTLYERCLERFASAGTPANGQEAAPAALDIHTYAMCCNNLGVLYNAQEQYEQAAAVLYGQRADAAIVQVGQLQLVAEAAEEVRLGRLAGNLPHPLVRTVQGQRGAAVLGNERATDHGLGRRRQADRREQGEQGRAPAVAAQKGEGNSHTIILAGRAAHPGAAGNRSAAEQRTYIGRAQAHDQPALQYREGQRGDAGEAAADHALYAQLTAQLEQFDR